MLNWLRGSADITGDVPPEDQHRIRSDGLCLRLPTFHSGCDVRGASQLHSISVDHRIHSHPFWLDGSSRIAQDARMRLFRWIGRVALVSSALAGSVHAGPGRSDLYLDPSDGRIHAVVQSKIDGHQLHLHVSALGTGVEPMPGFRGLAGSNVQTAFEIDQILRSGRLHVLTKSAEGIARDQGYVIPGERGRVPVRRLDAAGRIDFDAHSQVSYFLGFSAAGPPLPPGDYTTELWARGEPRLRILYSVDETGAGAIRRFVEVAHGNKPPPEAGTLFRYVTTEEDAKPLPAPISSEDWQALDPEARWKRFRDSVGEGTSEAAWIAFLLKEQDFAFVEQIAMSVYDAFQLHGIGEKLATADAPNWLRLLAWMRGDGPPQRGHGWTVIDGLLMAPEKRDVVYSWIKEHRLEPDFPDILESLEVSEKLGKPKRVDVARYLPPHQPDDVLRLLVPPNELAVLAPGSKARQDLVYTQQVVRAIDALVLSGRHSHPKMENRLRNLCYHDHPEVQQAAYLAYTHLPPTKIPLGLMEKIESEKVPDAVREAMLMAHSYHHGPEVIPDLLAIAAQPEHPAWRAALSRLGEIGGGFSIEVLAGLKPDNDAQAEPVDKTMGAIKDRITEIEKKRSRPAHQPGPGPGCLTSVQETRPAIRSPRLAGFHRGTCRGSCHRISPANSRPGYLPDRFPRRRGTTPRPVHRTQSDPPENCFRICLRVGLFMDKPGMKKPARMTPDGY